MTNDVRIGVSADTKGVDGGLGNTGKSVQKVTKTVEDLGRAAKKTASEIDKIEVSARRLERVQKILQSELGRNVSPGETRAFLDRFEAMRQNRHLTGGGKIRRFGSFEEWHSGHRQLFLDPREATRHHRQVVGMASGGNIPVAPGHTPPGAGSNLMRSGMRGAMHIGGGMLALSGVMGIMSMAGRAVDMARDEAMANDQLTRSLGDLNVEFDRLQTQVRSSTDGLGVAFTEAAKMAKEFVHESGAGAGVDVYGNLRTGMGMSRAFGFDPQVGVGFLAQMRHYGVVGSGDPTGKRMALNIAEAIEKGGTTAKADEVMSAVANFTAQVAKFTLAAPNAAGFAGALAGLTKAHIPGLDPTNAANLLMTADASMRRGGGMGEAGLNFTYGALSRANGNLNPVVAMAIAEQGLFGSGAGLQGSQLGSFLGKRGINVGGLSGRTNMELIKSEIDRQYGNSPIAIDAFKNYFGLGSYQQAASLYNLSPKKIGGLQGLVGAAGLSVEQISATGIQNLAQIGSASRPELWAHASKIMGRDDVSAGEKSTLRRLMAATGPDSEDALRTELARIVATREQEKNVGTETRDGVNAINNTLTRMGGAMLPIISGIQEAVVAMAGALAPESDVEKRYRGMNQIPEYLGKRKALERMIAEEDAKDPKWLEEQVGMFGEGWRSNYERQVELRREERRKRLKQLDYQYRYSIDAMEEQNRIESMFNGGNVPAGNPAGSPGGVSRTAIELSVIGVLNDTMGRSVGNIQESSTTVRPPLAAGGR